MNKSFVSNSSDYLNFLDYTSSANKSKAQNSFNDDKAATFFQNGFVILNTAINKKIVIRSINMDNSKSNNNL